MDSSSPKAEPCKYSDLDYTKCKIIETITMRHLFFLGIFFSLLLNATYSSALTLSEPRLHSNLGHPLEMTMTLKNLGDLSPEDLLIGLAPKERYQEMNIDLKPFHHDLKFTVINAPNHKGQLKVTSHEVINEPYLDFIILIRWPDGKLLKEVTVLFDAPSSH